MVFLAGCALALAPLSHGQGRTAQKQDPLLEIQRRLYEDPLRFEMLSNSMQNVLIAKFGPRPAFDSKGNPIEPAPLDHARGPSGPQAVLSALGNVLVNNAAADATAQDTQSETSLALGSGSNLIAAFNDSGSFIGADHFTGWAYSTDGGATWTDPGVLPGTNDAGDPVLARDNTLGRTYLAALFFNGSGINMFRSDDDGASWQAAVNGTPGKTGFMDKEWLAVDNFPGAGNGNVYLISREFGGGEGIFFFSSTDNGASYGPSGGTLIASGLSGNVQGAYVVVTPNHNLHAFWFDSSVSPFQLRTRRSTDFGATWSAPVTITTLTSNVTNGNLSLTAGFRSNSFPQVAVNPVSGHLYVVYNNPTAASGGDRGNILLRTSSDNGATWSAPITVNDDGTTRAQYFPAIVVRPDGLGLSLGWYDNRSDAADRLIERWGVTGTISGSTLTFGPNFRISPQFQPVFGVDPVVNTVYMGDYDQLVADATTYYSTWGDNRDDSTGAPGRKNANVRFTSYGEDGPGAILDFQSHTLSGGNGNGKLDFNECNQFSVNVKNNGSATATGILATLSSSTPGVTILNPTQALVDLAPGATGSPVLPFDVTTSPSFACNGATFTLSVSHAAGTDISGFSVVGSDDYVITVGSGALVAGTADVGNHGDDVTTSISLPFPVTYYGTPFSSAIVSSNGNLQFTGGSSAYSNECFPSGTLANVIAGHWDDLRTDGVGNGIFTSTTGVAPNREFHVEWRAIYFSGAGSVNFEIRLHEDTSDFEIVYAAVGQSAASASIGCQQGTGTRFTVHACDQSNSVGSGTQLSFSLPTCVDGGGGCGPDPVLSTVVPDHGSNAGGTVVLTGTDFTGANAVTFGPNSVPFTVDSNTQITVNYAATSTTGLVDVTVTTPSGSDTLTDGFDYFAPPREFGSACDVQTLTWSGAPILGENYTVTTQNLGVNSQLLLVDWSNQSIGGPKKRRNPPGLCDVLVSADTIVNLGNTASQTFTIPANVALVGVHLRTQAFIIATSATTQMLDATIGE